jgi:hypothetical protein
MQVVLDALDAGTGAGYLRIYDGARPATGGTVTNLLIEFQLGATPGTKPSGSVTSGVLTFANITPVAAAASGTATWARLVTSAGAFVADFNVGVSGADLNMTSVGIVATQVIGLTNGASITEGNA